MSNKSNNRGAFGATHGPVNIHKIERNELQPLRGMFQQIRAGVANFRSQSKAARNNLMVPAEGRFQLIDQLRTAGKAELLQMQVKAHGHAQDARADLATVKAENGYDGDAATRESIWRRTRALLDAGVDVAAIVQDSVERQDRGTLSVLRSEYRSYLWSKNGNLKSATDAAEGLNIQLDLEEAKIAGGDFARAVELEQELERGYQFLQTSLNYAQSEIVEDRDGAANVLPGWRGGEDLLEVPDAS